MGVFQIYFQKKEDEGGAMMFSSFEDAFNPSEEKKAQWREKLRNAQKEAIERKECWMCANTYMEPWNNHGHEDYTTHCKFTKKCVDFSNGKDCPNWKPRELIEPILSTHYELK